MNKYLVIVESPAKSKTIEKYLGSDYKVTSSKGHIRDLKTNGVGGFGVDIDNNFQPSYKILNDKLAVVRELKKDVKESDKVFLATDPDREGEAISWHLAEVLGLDNSNSQRIEFHEITKTAVLNAFQNGREINMDLVRSQESRRILDRIIGFSLSKLLQNKIGSKSAGRVQSVALKLIVEKEKEVSAFKADEYWDIYLDFKEKDAKVRAKLILDGEEKIKLDNKEAADNVINNLGREYKIKNIIFREREKASREPYITSTLQQDASSKLGFNAKKTMMIAQKLYEGVELKNERVGLITYMRTDSFRLSQDFINEAKAEIIKNYGANYYKGYFEKNKGKNVQDAHEAIRPTRVFYKPEEVKPYLDNDEIKLYSLIYSRAMASLMANAVVEDQKVLIENNGYIFEANGEKTIFDGYLGIYKDTEEDIKSLPDLKEGQVLKGASATSEQKFTNPPLRYNEARLIRKMEELGIGRPSTYAITIETLKARNYVKLEKKCFVPTKQGELTSEKLSEFFESIINVKYTAEMEETLDKIARGDVVWYTELKKFYDAYMPLLNKATNEMKKIYPIYLDEVCPNCGKPLVIRNGRFGEFAACSGYPTCHYIKKKEPEPVVDTNIICPKCGKGTLVERVSKRGRSKGQKFYACSRYPKCDATYSQLPEKEEN